MKDLNRREILASKDFKLEPVDVPEWEGRVYVRTLTGGERDAFEDDIIQRRDKKTGIPKSVVGLKILLVSLSACDKDGKRLFAGDGDEKKLAQKSAAAIERIFEVAQRLSRVTDEAVEELVSDLADGPSESSGSS